MNSINKILNSVKVIFEDEKYNYETNVSADSTKKSCEQYFVGKFFDVGSYPVENLQKCISIEFIDNNQPILYKFSKLAYDAHRNISFDPDKRRDQVINEYSVELESDLSEINDDSDKDRYKQGYEKHFSNWLSAKSRCFSVMITGPANFPIRRHEKANRSEENRYREFREWRKRALKAISKKNEALKPGEQKQKEKFDKIKNCILNSASVIISIDKGIEKGYSRSLFVSAIVGTVKTLSKNGDYEAVKMALDFITEINQKAEKPIITKNHSIWELLEKTQDIKKEIIETSLKESEEEIINDIKIVKNYQEDRVQIYFNGKPSQEIINKLKSNAWRWSPSNKCWQRKLTRQAEIDAKKVIE
jgi:hypothetical protein